MGTKEKSPVRHPGNQALHEMTSAAFAAFSIDSCTALVVSQCRSSLASLGKGCMRILHYQSYWSCPDRFPKVFQQFLGDIWAFQPHDAFLRTPVAEKIDAAVPNDLLVDDGKFLMDVGFEQKAHA
jgi:hypothetical protein